MTNKHFGPKNVHDDNKELRRDAKPGKKYKAWLDGKGIRHREDGPAVEWEDGTKEWWVKGMLHRTDGPAIEFPNGDAEWWVNGRLHRDDGPAIDFTNGYKEWWVNGKFIKRETN